MGILYLEQNATDQPAKLPQGAFPQNQPNTNAQNSPSQNALLRMFSRMSDSELRDPKQLFGLSRATGISFSDEGIFIAESRNVIERALNAGHTPFALISEQRWLEPHHDLFKRINQLENEANDPIPQFIGSHETICAITGFQRTVGPIAAFHRPVLPSVPDLLENAHRVAILEDITNFTNIGAIFRSAAALGIDAVLVTPGCHDPFYRRAARVSMGTVFQVPWTRIGATPTSASKQQTPHPSQPTTHNTNNTNRNWATEGLPLLHELGFTTVALALKPDSLRLQDPRIAQAEKLALVLGTEGDGLAQETIAQCDYTVCIPMAHEVDSLNVAAASAVAFWETCGRFK